ncbi:MAG: hypothetical protein IJH61_00260 [Eubacteriaceae bacterium]|nr:hypothetical protein [Eubacteriaceae bacterium]
MKAKTTWLIGLLIALMMVVTAVPAFAQDEQQPVDNANQDVAVEAQDDEPNFVSVTGFSAVKNIVYSKETPYEFIKFNVTYSTQAKTEAEKNTPYYIRIDDVSEEGKDTNTRFNPIPKQLEIGGTPETNKTVEYQNGGVGNTSIFNGKHTFKLRRVASPSNDAEVLAELGTATVYVYDKPTAYQTANTATDHSGDGTITGEINQPVNLSAFASGGYDGNVDGYTYTWQKSKTTTGASPGDPTSDDWTNIASGKSATYTMKFGDDGYFIRCLVTDKNKKTVVAQINSADSGTYAVQLATTSLKTITITQPAKETNVTKVVGQQFDAEIAAEGGQEPYRYQWKKGAAAVTKGSTAADGTYTINPVTTNDTGNYTCVVSDSSNPTISATSKNTHLDVVAAPKFTINTNAGTKSNETAATWSETNAGAVAGSSTLTLTADQAKNPLRLTLNVTGDLSGKTFKWYKGDEVDPIPNKDNIASIDVSADDIKTCKKFKVEVQYPGDPYNLAPATYTLNVVITGGTISATNGGIFTQAGDNDPTVSPVYTITLPEGIRFNSINPGTPTGWTVNAPTGLAVEVTKVTSAQNTAEFKFVGKSEVIPYVKDLELTIDKDRLVLTEDTSKSPDNDVIFPVSSDFGFLITATDAPAVKIEKPGVENGTAKPNENVYDGNAIPAKIVKNDDNGPDIGTVTNVRYLSIDKYNEIKKDTKITDKDTAYYNASTTTVPKDANDYKVWCDVTKSTAYPTDAKKIGPMDYKINPATAATMNAKAEEKGYENYFTWTKSKKKTGSELSADLAFKSSLTKKGKITEIKYYKTGTPSPSPEVRPVDVGVYDIYIKTANDGDKNKCENVAAFNAATKIGTFEITDKDPVPETKLDPTKDLYEMSPTSATADGKEHGTTVTAKTSAAGEVTATNYYDSKGTKVSGKPSKAGEYTVKIDTEENDTYKAAKDLEIGTFTIKGATPTASMYTMTPKSGSSVTANGKGQGVTVKADDPKVAGEPTVKYYDKDGKAVSGQPVKAGKYTVRIDTAASDYYAAGKDIAMGTFEITQGTPTKAMNLYKLDPATNPYTGKANPTKVVPAGDNGAGEVEAIHYTRKTTKVKESDEGPVAIGVYTVTVDAKASDSFKAVKGLEVGDYEIIDQGIFLRAHVENLGWDKTMSELEPGTEKTVGTEGRALRVEAIDIAVPAGYSVEGFAHIQNLADTNCVVLNGSEADYPAGVPAGYTVYRFGSTGRGLRMEAMQINLKDASGTTMSQLKYCVHVENDGWHAFVNNGTFAGTRGRGLRLEALRFAYAR